MALKDFLPMQERCSNCSYCKFVPFDKMLSARFSGGCPSVAYYNFNTASARGRFQLGQAIVKGEVGYSKATSEIVRDCLACGACDVACKVCRYNLEPLANNIAIKADMAENGIIFPEQQKMIDRLGVKKADRGAWSEGLGLKDLSKESGDLLFFPGCSYTRSKALWPALRAMVELLRKSGAQVGYLGENDACCAARIYQQGLMNAFEAQAERNIANIRAAGVKTIVTPCADCYHAFKRLYAERGLEVEVLHIVEYVDRLLEQGKLSFTKNVCKTVTYHDPCHLGRLGEPYVAWDGKEKKIFNQVHTWEPRRPRYNGAYGVYDAPRRILAAIPGLKLTEMERIREYSWCCGAGAAADKNNPEFSEWTASERVTEANATGAEIMVSACPHCEERLAGVKDENGRTIEVMDIFALIMMAL